MKKFILLFAVMLFGLIATAQTTLTNDTLQGAETVYFDSFRYTGAGDVVYQALCTELGGTSDGTLVLQGSIDGTNWNTLTEKTNYFIFFPSDTLTIVDGGVFTAVIKKSALNYFRSQGIGTSGDTTLVSHKWDYKR